MRRKVIKLLNVFEYMCNTKRHQENAFYKNTISDGGLDFSSRQTDCYFSKLTTGDRRSEKM